MTSRRQLAKSDSLCAVAKRQGQNTQDQRLATADETTHAGGIASPLHPLVRYFMGREVRMVPKDWQHPKDERGFVELHARSILQYEDANTPDDERIQADDLMPDFGESATHMMMYETCTAGTPISPACETAEELAKWLADNGASAFGRQTATYDQWLAMIGVGNAPSLVVDNGGIRSGVEWTAT